MTTVFGFDLAPVRTIGEEIIRITRPAGWPASPLADWPLGSFEAAFLITIAYLAFILVGIIVVPLLPPIKGLYPFKFVYNMVQVMLCSYMFISAGVIAYEQGHSLYIPCNKFNHEHPPFGFILYVFYLSKILDFLDTVFIILEKRWKQLSFLHVYHHAGIFLIYWMNSNVGYDGDIFYTIMLNGFIHTVMYAYYFVSLHTKEIWWKPALTICQMIQFVFMNAHAIYLLNTGCTEYPVNLIYAYLGFVLSMLVLFGQFFLSTYSKGGKKGGKKNNKDSQKEE